MGLFDQLVRYFRYQRTAKTQATQTEVVLRAEGQAQQLLLSAADQAEKIIQEAVHVRSTIEKRLNATVAKSQLIIEEHIQHELAELSGQLKELAVAVATDLQQTTAQYMANATTTNQQQLASLHVQLTKIVRAEEKKLHDELTEVRRKKIYSLTTTLEKEIPDIVKDVVGRSLALHDHEELVRDALKTLAIKKDWI